MVDGGFITAIWRKHLIICLLLGLLAVPIYFLDLASNGGGGGNWITLDFRGFIFWTYITLLAIHVALTIVFGLAGMIAFVCESSLNHK